MGKLIKHKVNEQGDRWYANESDQTAGDWKSTILAKSLRKSFFASISALKYQNIEKYGGKN